MAKSIAVNFQQGNASRMPFAASRFDFVICRAAFKNFSEPVRAIEEMYRVLKAEGSACIIDLRGDATLEDIRAAVQEMKLSALNRRLTLWAFTSFLLKNAYTGQMQALVAQTAFAGCIIREDRIGMQVWLEK